MSFFSNHRRCRRTLRSLSALLLACLSPAPLLADVASATAAMEDPGNPLLEISTARGEIYVELLPDEAPNNVANFLALAAGELELIDEDTGFSFYPRYYDGMRFHRVIPGFVIQAGSPDNHPLGAPPELIDDEINARALGLHEQPVLMEDSSVNAALPITEAEDFAEQVLAPLYAEMGIDAVDGLRSRQDEVVQRLENMDLQGLYELQGYDYTEAFPTRVIDRGVVALANTGPNSNGPEFFIALNPLPSLTGKYTVIGHVVEGMEVVERIGAVAIDPLQFSRLSTVIYDLRRVDEGAEQDPR